jgi:DNA repair protein RadD
MTISLRPNQSDLIARVRQTMAQTRRVLMVAATGFGKTVCFAYLAARAAERGRRVLILVHRQELLDQTIRALAEQDAEYGIVAAGYLSRRAPLVQVGSAQTVMRREVEAPDLIIVDEGHHAVSPSWRKLLARWLKAFILGVTATPSRLDGRGLGDIFEAMVLGPPMRELIDDGFLSDFTVYAPSVPDLGAVHTKMGDYDNRELTSIMGAGKLTGDAVAHYKRLCNGAPAVAFCVSIDHARQVAADFAAAGVRSAAIDGGLDRVSRRALIDGLRTGGAQVLTSCELISEGLDIPALGAAILLRPTQSLALHRQQIGRALRPAPGKTKAIILDHAGNTMRHGLPDDEPEWTLEGRKRKASDGDSAPAIRRCPECFAVMRATATQCSECQYIFQVVGRLPEQEAGELVEIDAETLRRQRRSEQGRAQTLEALIEIGGQRGYRPGWAQRVMEARAKRG